jgi:hypothetical protein
MKTFALGILQLSCVLGSAFAVPVVEDRGMSASAHAAPVAYMHDEMAVPEMNERRDAAASMMSTSMDMSGFSAMVSSVQEQVQKIGKNSIWILLLKCINY